MKKNIEGEVIMFLYNKKKYTAILLPLCLISFLLASCSLFGGNTPPKLSLVKAPAKKQIYTIPETGVTDFATLDPALTHDPTSTSAIQMIYTGLVQLDDKLRIRPQLALSWNQGSDGMTWTFHLRPHLKFSDGLPLTSADIAYSIDRALQPATRSTVAPLYLGLIRDANQLQAGRVQTLIGDSLQTPDANTLIISTRKKAAYFLSMLTVPCSYVVEKSLVKKYGAAFSDHLTDGGGAGPFKVAQYTHGKAITFVPNPNYYNAQPQLQQVVMAFYPSDDAAYQAYQANRVDTTGVPISTFATDRKRKDFVQVPQLWINYYTMNYLAKPFDNINLRRAFALAIDKPAIVNTVWKGTVLPTNHIVPRGMTTYNANLTGPEGTQNLKGNPTEAKALLQKGLREEKWSSVAQFPPIKLTYATGVSSFDAEVDSLIRMWQSVLGVAVTADPVSFNDLLAKITAATGNANGLQFWGFSWVAEYPDPQDWLTLQFDSGMPNNNMNYGQNASTDAAKQQSLQRLLEAADANSNPSARLQAYRQAEQQLVDDVAWLPMEQVTQIFLRQPYVIGMVDNALGVTPPDDWANIYIAQH